MAENCRCCYHSSMVDIVLPTLSCQKCGWKWTPRKSSRPAMCPHCGSRKWEATNEPSGAQAPEKEWAVPEIRDGEDYWSWVIRIGDSIPHEEAAKMPEDGSINHDHYLYGSPRKY